MQVRYLFVLTAAALALMDPRPAQAVVIDDQADILAWQYENPGKASARHRLSDRAAGPILKYTNALGPVHINTKFGKRIDERCAAIEVTYEIQRTLRRDGQRVTYRQAVPVPFCKGGGLPDGHLSRPDSAGFFAEQEAAEAARGLTDKNNFQKEKR